MGLRYYPRYFADMLYQLCISVLLYIIIISGCAIGGIEFLSHTYVPIWLFGSILFVLNIPVLSQLLASFTDSGRVSSIIGIFVILIESIMGVVWTSAFYGKDIENRTVNMWFAAIPGMSPIVILSMVNGLIIT